VKLASRESVSQKLSRSDISIRNSVENQRQRQRRDRITEKTASGTRNCASAKLRVWEPRQPRGVDGTAKGDLVSLEALLLDMLEDKQREIPSWGVSCRIFQMEKREEREGGAGEGGGVVLKAWGRGKRKAVELLE
jgi:hypothetical protein